MIARDSSSNEEKIPVTVYLSKGEAIKVETVSADPEHILLRVDEVGEVKSRRQAENFPLEIKFESAEKGANRQPSLVSNWELDILTDPQTLLWLAVTLYFFVRILRLADFPIFFFSDEAMPVVRAQEFLANRFRSRDDVLFPTFFKNTFQFSLSTTVYMQLLGYALFGKSIFVTRLLAVFSTLPAAIGMGWIFKSVYKYQYWFVGTLLFSSVPAWFLHSRTAFEVVTAIGFYVVFVYFYFTYRETADFWRLALALTGGALCFYSYNPARLVIVLSGILLFVSDLNFHWEQRHHSAKGLAVLILLILPYLRHQWLYPQSVSEHLYGLGSYWVRELPLSERLSLFFQEYLKGLNPFYWYMPEQHEWVRHHMKGYGHLSRYFAPFAIWGFALAVYRFREAKYRNLLLLLIAAPAGAALVEIYITRAMFFIVPATLLTTIGLLEALQRLWGSGWLTSRLGARIDQRRFGLAILIVFGLLNLALLRDALKNGPTWYDNYGLGGLQYGASQVFGKAEELLEEVPGRLLYISTTWTNGTNTVALFFFDDPLPFQLIDLPRDNLKKKYPMTDDTVFILTREDYDAMVGSDKFTNIQVSETIKLPNGVDGFFILTANYVPNVEEIFAAELEELRKPREIRLNVSGYPARIFYPAIDLGRIEHIFDGNILTLGRTDEGNPATFRIIFDEPVAAAGLRFDVRDRAADVTALIETADGDSVEGFGSFNGQTGDPIGEILFADPIQMLTVNLTVHDPQQGDLGHIHLWEIAIIPTE